MYCVLLAILFGWSMVSARPRVFEVCRGRLVEIPEPANWRALPDATGPRDDSLRQLGDASARLGPFAISGRLTMPKYGIGWADCRINDPGFCASSSVSLDAWFERGPEPRYSRTPDELHLRQDGRGAFVVSGSVWGSEAPVNETFVVAFRRELGLYPRFGAPDDLLLCLLLSTGLISSLCGVFWGGRALHRMRRADAEALDASGARRSDTDIARARIGLLLALLALAVGVIWFAAAVLRTGFEPL